MARAAAAFLGDRRPVTDFKKEANFPKNSIKHLNSVKDRIVTFDAEEEAVDMILRAAENVRELGLPVAGLLREFENWYYRTYIAP